MASKMARDLKSSTFHSHRRWFQRSGWFLLFIGSGVFIYLQAMRQKEASYREMADQLHLLEEEKARAASHRDELLLQIQSQSDPAWIEMILKRNLGMVHEGEEKVYFYP